MKWREEKYYTAGAPANPITFICWESAEQFDIALHYDRMEQLDRDVHDNVDLSRSEVEVAFKLVGHVPERVFLPCFGTGRHIPHLLERGVKRIVGVDLSPKCVAKAHGLIGDNSRVKLEVGDLREWKTNEQFAAALLLGNSFGDLLNYNELAKFARALLAPLAPDGAFVMDYIGAGYLTKVDKSIWDATIDGVAVSDERFPTFNPFNRVMTIRVNALAKDSGEVVYSGRYQKKILERWRVKRFFRKIDMRIRPMGIAHELNPYYQAHGGELGMIAKSTWWIGRK